MRRRLLLAVATGLVVAAPPAQADHWPVGGGNPTRASTMAGLDQTPIMPTWSAPDGAVRTPIVITGGGGSGTQRVAYGTNDGYLHLRMLESGAPVGPGEGVDLDGSSIRNDNIFGTDNGSVAFADTSTEQRHGVLYVVHNDEAGAAAVYLARVRVDNGEVIDENPITGTVGCVTNSSPLLTPPAPSGGRVLYFTMRCALYTYLVRVPIEGDASSPEATLGATGFALVPDTSVTASPTLVVLREEGGAPRYYVAVSRLGGLSLFHADDALEAAPGNSPFPPSITAELADAKELPQTLAVPPAANGAVAGAEGSNTGPAPALYVAAADATGNATRVYRFTQEGSARTLRATAVTDPLPASGPPAPGMAVSQTMTSEGLTPGGTLLVPSATNVTLLRADDLSVAAQLTGTPLPPGLGFARSTPLVSGQLAFLVRDGTIDRPSEHLVLRLDGLTPLQSPSFSAQPDPVPGPASGQPAGSHGNVVFGTGRGPFAYASAGARPSPRETITPLPPRACERTLAGSTKRDRIRGTGSGDRILGGPGGDKLDGRAGPDCVFGQGGKDVLRGGSGDDLLEGGPGADRIDAGPGDDRVVARDRGRDKVVCGKGRDVAVVDRRDRVSRSCERVKKRR